MQKRGTTKRVLDCIRKYRISVALSVLLATITVILTLYVPILAGRAIDAITTKGAVEFGKITIILVKIGIVVLLASLFQWLMNVINNRVAFGVVHDLRKRAFAKIEKLPLKFIDGHSHGELVSRIIADADQFSDGLLIGFTQLFTGVLTILGTLFFMFRLNIGITAMVIIITPASLVVAKFVAKSTYSMFRIQSQVRGEQTALIDEMITNQKTVKAFSYEKRAEERFDEINERLERCSLKAIFFSSITNPSTRFINAMVYAVVALFGAFSVIKGNITVGGLTCFLSYANQYTKPFNEISGVITELQNALACATRIFELIDESEEVEQEGETLLNARGKVEFSDVYFSYTAGRKLIENLNLSVSAGQKIAIVGPTGCGKTTLINLLMRFYDVARGTISVDGLDIRSVTRQSLRKSFGMVLQETWIKKGTVRENIALGKPDATDAEIIAAAKATHAHSFIKRLKNGYDTEISDNDALLSQGEKQLICIARVMLIKPPMLILDEATSSIDTRTEMKIQDAFKHLMHGRTSFIVAHRLSTVRDADTILVMKDGKIIEQGKHDDLILKKGFYYELYNSQFAK